MDSEPSVPDQAAPAQAVEPAPSSLSREEFTRAVQREFGFTIWSEILNGLRERDATIRDLQERLENQAFDFVCDFDERES